ncbi:amidohydrolase family protein [Dyadobacter sp. LJ53]|uniref:amidohydrolase family protein n=1 Tax=Dyadobacter chenwenxiniae TaxID=2906456 RepID=UPI001F212E66|nr:amidohydrolase family protein [Dyadobacter chenwenxiniae]MCF0051505.1 amidohydrolase family protein [Dyadobacter chenwenxiniae]
MMQNKKTAIINANVFDGKEILGQKTVVFQNGKFISISKEVPVDAEVIDGRGCTLLPGLIDAHVHTSEDTLRDAILFGVTTELEMQGGMTRKGRELQIKDKSNIADVRSSGMALTAPGGHPDELIPKEDGIPSFILKKMEKMTEKEKKDFVAAFEERENEDSNKIDVTIVDGAVQFVRQQIENGADYFKVMIEEGTVMNAPGLPMIKTEVLKAAVNEAHKLGKIAIAHVLTAEAAKTAIEVGVDGLAHLFIDRPSWTPELIKSIADKRIFVTPCLVLNSSIIGNSACHVAKDERVEHKLNKDWKATMCSCFNTFPSGKMEDSFNNVKDLHDAGVDILVGTDVSVPMAHLGGLAHGVSVHHEMQLLVEAGLSPIDALRSATSVTAKRFSLTDRGSIAEGLRADLILVKGNPTENISDSLSILSVWKEGVKINLDDNANKVQ